MLRKGRTSLLASDHAQVHFHIYLEQFTSPGETPSIHRCLTFPRFCPEYNAYCISLSRNCFAINDRTVEQNAVEQNHCSSFYTSLTTHALEAGFKNVLK